MNDKNIQLIEGLFFKDSSIGTVMIVVYPVLIFYEYVIAFRMYEFSTCRMVFEDKHRGMNWFNDDEYNVFIPDFEYHQLSSQAMEAAYDEAGMSNNTLHPIKKLSKQTI